MERHNVLELDILGVKVRIETHFLEDQDFAYEASPRRSLVRGLIV